MKQNCKCNECELCRKMQKAGIRKTISALEKCLKNSKISCHTVKGILLSLRSILSTYNTPVNNCLLNRIKSLLDVGELEIETAAIFSNDQRAAISIFIAELKAFVGEDESAVADKSAE